MEPQFRFCTSADGTRIAYATPQQVYAVRASRSRDAGGDEILIPEPLRHLLTGKSYVYADRGKTMLKGFEDAVRLYEVRWRDEVA